MTSSQIGKMYYCSSPALDWRLSGINTIDACITPDPLIYFSEAAVEQLYQHVDIQKGLGIPPPRPKSIQKQTNTEKSLEMSSSTKNNVFAKAIVDTDEISAASKRSQPAQPSTPSKKARKGDITSTSISPTKDKRDSQVGASPSVRGKNQSKWSAWEDDMMKEAVVCLVDKHLDWKALHAQINEGRQGEAPRSLESVKKHWVQSMKAKMTQV